MARKHIRWGGTTQATGTPSKLAMPDLDESWDPAFDSMLQSKEACGPLIEPDSESSLGSNEADSEGDS